MDKKIKVYVAGPYTGRDPAENVAHAMNISHNLLDLGFLPYCPHLHHFMHIQRTRTYEDWFELVSAFIPACDVLLRLEGHSPGADTEVEIAREHNIPVFHRVEDLYRWGNS